MCFGKSNPHPTGQPVVSCQFSVLLYSSQRPCIQNAEPNPTRQERSNKSAATKKKNTTEITPFMVKNAALSFERS